MEEKLEVKAATAACISEESLMKALMQRMCVCVFVGGGEEEC